jgi:hypothetical protein
MKKGINLLTEIYGYMWCWGKMVMENVKIAKQLKLAIFFFFVFFTPRIRH